MSAQKVKPMPEISCRSSSALGAALNRYRALENLSQTALAESAGLRQATISNVEHGNDASEIKTIFTICAALGLEVVLRPRKG